MRHGLGLQNVTFLSFKKQCSVPRCEIHYYMILIKKILFAGPEKRHIPHKVVDSGNGVFRNHDKTFNKIVSSSKIFLVINSGLLTNASNDFLMFIYSRDIE